MATEIRPELSPKSKYYIPRERYLELKHFCYQYSQWKKELDAIVFPHGSSVASQGVKAIGTVERLIFMRNQWLSRIEMVENAAKKADPEFWTYILAAVTKNLSCNYLIMHGMPCGRDKYYEMYRRFFYILSKDQYDS